MPKYLILKKVVEMELVEAKFDNYFTALEHLKEKPLEEQVYYRIASVHLMTDPEVVFSRYKC